MKNINTKFSLMYDLIAKALQLTQNILEKSEQQDINQVVSLLDQRERLINVIQKLEKELNEIPKELHAKYWTDEITDSLDLIKKYDDQIILNLEAAKINTHNEIANTFQNKEKIKGYNLNNLK